MPQRLGGGGVLTKYRDHMSFTCGSNAWFSDHLRSTQYITTPITNIVTNVWFNPKYAYQSQSSVQYSTHGSIYKLRINPKYVNKSTIHGSIHNMWINPQLVDQSTIFGSIHNLLINPWYVDQSTISGYKRYVWIIQQLRIHLKVL